MPFSQNAAEKGTRPLFLSDGAEGVSLAVRVMPRAGVTKIAGVRDDRLLVRLAAAPVDGAANEVLLTFLSKALGISARDITLAAGRQNRNKRIVLSGVTRDDAERRLQKLLSSVV